MTDTDHQQLLRAYGDIINTHQWDRLGECFLPDSVLEYPQSGERFRGLANIRAQFENYPGFEPGDTGDSEIEEVIGGTTYALTPSYTVIAIEGSGDRGSLVVRIRYPDGSRWRAVNLYQLRDGRIASSKVYFAPDFEAPDWRAPYREAP